MARSSNLNTSDFNYGNLTFLNGQTSALWSFWINVVTWDQTFQMLWSKDDYPTNVSGWGFQRNGTTDQIVYFTRGGAFQAGIGTSFAGAGWIHLAAYQDTASSYKTWKSGVQISTGGTSGNPFGTHSVPLTTSVWNDQIKIAETAIWRDLTLTTAATIVANVSAGRSPANQTLHPIFYDPLTEGASGVATLSDIMGVLSPTPTATTSSNSTLVTGPTVDAPPSPIVIDTKARPSQVGILAAEGGTPKVRPSQVGILAADVGTPKVRPSQVGILAADVGTPKLRASQVGILAIVPFLQGKTHVCGGVCSQGPVSYGF